MLLLLALACAPPTCGGASLDAVARRCRAAYDAPGLAVAWTTASDEAPRVALSGEAALDEAGGEPLSPDHLLRVGSVTKTLTGTLVLVLADEGLLDLDAPVADLLPGMGLDPRITPRLLLEHRSGLASYRDHPDLDAGAPHAPEELLALALDLGPLDEPGAAFHYASTNFVALGLIVEAVTGGSWAGALRARVLDPLALDGFAFTAESLPAPAARGYERDGEGWADVTDRVDPSVRWAAGALAAPVGDLARWAAALGEGALLELATAAARLDALPRAEGSERAYGLGLSVDETASGPAWGHRGRGDGFHAWTAWYPEAGVAVAAVFNRQSREADPVAVADAVIAALDAR